MNNTRILVVDDDREIVRLIQGYLKEAGYQTLDAYDGEVALQILRAEKPDLLLLDVMLPNYSGYEIIRIIRADERLAATPVIMLTARVEDIDKILGLELGADDYVTKPFNPREVVARVNALLRRNQRGAPIQVSQIGALRMDIGRRVVLIEGKEVSLTRTEFNLLRIFMENPGYVFTRSELAQKGLGYEFAGLDRTLDGHIKNLRQKIEPDPSQPRFIQTVYGIGYRLAEME